MTDPNSLPDGAYSSLERLVEDPDERVATLQSQRPAEDDVRRQTAVFKALGNESRLQLLNVLRDGECCVCELQVVLDAPQSTVATHLRKLKDAGLVKSRKKGKWTYYRIADTATFELLDLAAAVYEGD
jgi:DNA-binding transcriptional ArsR family regulator